MWEETVAPRVRAQVILLKGFDLVWPNPDLYQKTPDIGRTWYKLANPARR